MCRRLRPVHVLAALVSLTLCAGPAWALDEDAEWLGPGQGDIELRTALDLSHLFDFGLSEFSVRLAFGYFFTDSFEGGLSGSLGFTAASVFRESVAAESASSSEAALGTPDALSIPDGVGVIQQALTVGAIARRDGGWHGTTMFWLRFFPFEAPGEPILPRVFAPFVELELGPQYGEGITPYLVWTAWLGANIYATEQLALGLRMGYALTYATDETVRHDGRALDHTILADLAFSVFFTP